MNIKQEDQRYAN